MKDDLSPGFIRELLAAQGCPIDEADAALIAANLGAQLRTAHHAYGELAFEAEPSGFDAAMRQGAIR